MIELGTNDGAPVGFDPTVLKTHCTLVGMTGSGKTGLLLGMTEELVRNKIPVVMLDVKGDLANIFLTDPEILATMQPMIITPGSDHGHSVSITSGLSNPDRICESITALLDLVGIDSDAITSRHHVFLSAILADRHAKKQRCELVDLIMAIQQPPFQTIGVMELDDVIGQKTRSVLAAKLNNVHAARSFEHWRNGIALDIATLTAATEPDKTPVIIYSIAHLTNNKERLFAISLLLDEMVSYMRCAGGTDDLRMTLLIDECAGLMPPTGSCPTKEALLTLLQQGRSMGIGVVLSTQNPMQIDYKAMSNCGTWLIGRLTTDNDRRRLVQGVCNSVPGLQKKAFTEQIGALTPRSFLMSQGAKLTEFRSRSTSCELPGPMTRDEIRVMFPKPPAPPAPPKPIGRMMRLFRRMGGSGIEA